MLGVPVALLAAVALVAVVARGGTGVQLLAAGLYGVGLAGMPAASAAYNLAAPGRGKAVLRRLDHAMIFVMIAGSYTPFALCALPPRLGLPLFVGAWAVGLMGAGLKLVLGNRYGAAFMALYFVHGWMLLAVIRPVMAALSPAAMALLAAGGAVYSVGAFVHTRERWPFHNAVWHAMVLLGAGLQFGAIADVLGVAAIVRAGSGG